MDISKEKTQEKAAEEQEKAAEQEAEKQEKESLPSFFNSVTEDGTDDDGFIEIGKPAEEKKNEKENEEEEEKENEKEGEEEEKKGEGKKDDKDGKEGGEQEKEKDEKDENDDLFNEYLEKENADDKKESATFDYKEFGQKRLGLEFEKDQEVNEETFIEAVNKKIDAAKNVTEFDLSSYNDETKKVINFVQEGGDPRDFVDPLKDVMSFLSLTDEQKVRALKINELQKSGITKEDALTEKADEYIEQLIESGKFDDAVENAYNLAHGYRDNVIKTVIENFNSKQTTAKTKLTEQESGERNEMIAVAKATKEFMGIPLPEKVIERIVKDIETGTVHRELNNAKASLDAYLYMRFGKQAHERLKAQIEEVKGDAHRSGVDKVKEALHNNAETDGIGKNTGHQTKKKSGEGPFSAWSDIEDDSE